MGWSHCSIDRDERGSRAEEMRRANLKTWFSDLVGMDMGGDTAYHELSGIKSQQWLSQSNDLNSHALVA